MADLALPPQVLADLIEALYRTYVDDAEIANDAAGMREAFAREIATPYPKLFASRRGIRTPRILKAFALYEQLQANPDAGIIGGLLAQLPADSDTTLFDAPPVPDASPPADTSLDEADEAFDDGQFDRAFEFYLRLTPSKKTVSRLVSCVGTIGTDDARDRLLELLASAEPSLLVALAPAVTTKIESFRSSETAAVLDVPDAAEEPTGVDPWMRWAKQLQSGKNLAEAERAVQSAATAWDTTEIRANSQLAKAFAEILGGLNGDASLVARSAVPQIYVSFFPEDAPVAPTTKPIASLLFLLIAMDDKLSRTDLDLLGQLTAILIEQGLSPDEYVALMDDLTDVQKRVGSYSYLPWSLDVSEVLATLPCPTDAARDARLRLFLQVVGQASGFAHRLIATDLIPIETLARDYGVGDEAVAALKRDASQGDAVEEALPDLHGKTIGIYTLAEAAGSRAKAALEKMFPGCKVVLNSDLVATAQLSNLAKMADLFVFAWKSSSHQAFYCVKDALASGEPIWAPGKGTASILRAVLDHCSP